METLNFEKFNSEEQEKILNTIDFMEEFIKNFKINYDSKIIRLNVLINDNVYNDFNKNKEKELKETLNNKTTLSEFKNIINKLVPKNYDNDNFKDVLNKEVDKIVSNYFNKNNKENNLNTIINDKEVINKIENTISNYFTKEEHEEEIIEYSKNRINEEMKYFIKKTENIRKHLLENNEIFFSDHIDNIFKKDGIISKIFNRMTTNKINSINKFSDIDVKDQKSFINLFEKTFIRGIDRIEKEFKEELFYIINNKENNNLNEFSNNMINGLSKKILPYLIFETYEEKMKKRENILTKTNKTLKEKKLLKLNDNNKNKIIDDIDKNSSLKDIKNHFKSKFEIVNLNKTNKELKRKEKKKIKKEKRKKDIHFTID